MDPLVGSLAIGGLNLVTGLFGQSQQEATAQAVAKSQAKAQKKQASYNIKAAQENYKQTVENINKSAEYQRFFNAKAANDAWWDVQVRHRELFEQLATARLPMLQKVMAIQGMNEANEQQGKSKNRIQAVEVMGNYGRDKAMQNSNVRRAVQALQRQAGLISDRLYAADYQGQSQAISAANQAQSAYLSAAGQNTAGLYAQPQYVPQSNPMLTIGNAIAQGVGTYMSYQAPAAGNINMGMPPPPGPFDTPNNGFYPMPPSPF